jgi:hypothetical protein
VDVLDEPGKRVAILTLGILAIAVIGVGAFVLLVLVEFDCGGFDSEPASGSAICRARWPLGLTLGAAALAGPLFGTVAAYSTRTWRGLAIGIAVGAVSLAVIVLAMQAA